MVETDSQPQSQPAPLQPDSLLTPEDVKSLSVANRYSKEEKEEERQWVKAPQVGETTGRGWIGFWLKQPGEWVEKYEPIVEMESDKVNMPIESPFSGFLQDPLEIATEVESGDKLCWIRKGDKPLEDQNQDKKIEKNIDEDLKVDKDITTNEKKDNIKDEEKSGQKKTISASKPLSVEQEEPQQRVQKVSTIVSHRPIDTPAIHIRKTDEQPRISVQIYADDTIIPLTTMRRQIAEHMVRSERTAPHATAVMETDMTGVVAYRNVHKEEFEKKEGIKLTYLPFAIKAATLALNDHPRLNAVFDEDHIIERGAKNIGIAIGLEDGLIVPVIKHADRLSLTGLAHELAGLTDKAKTGRLTPDDVTGGTFTVNNPGTFGTLMSTPIIVQPQVAILSTEAIIKRPTVIEDDRIAIRSMMNLSLSIDHRAVDGLGASRFLQQVKKWLEGVNEKTPLY